MFYFLLFTFGFRAIYLISKHSRDKCIALLSEPECREPIEYIDPEKQRREEQRLQLAEMDYSHYCYVLEMVNKECADLERQLAEETSPSIREKLYRRIAVLNEKAYQTDRKRQIAFNKLN